MSWTFIAQIITASCAKNQITAAAIKPKLHRHASSNPVSHGRFHTAAITPTNDCVPRTGAFLRLVFAAGRTTPLLTSPPG
jgi:hypothetical protein